MYLKKLLNLFIITCCILIGCTDDRQEVSENNVKKESAYFKVPKSDYMFVIERIVIHEYLAEYDRNIILMNGDQIVKQIEMFPDTGGYSQTDLYRAGKTKYILKDRLNDCYLIDVSDLVLVKLDECENINRSSHELIGSFDTDQEKNWKFLPASKIP